MCWHGTDCICQLLSACEVFCKKKHMINDTLLRTCHNKHLVFSIFMFVVPGLGQLIQVCVKDMKRLLSESPFKAIQTTLICNKGGFEDD